jgi:catechol 2,3-dioxygenase-like lactoylglutathione lyase family enzyme
MTDDVPYLPDPDEVAAPVSRISHLSLTTPRLEAMVRHYTTVLGLTHVSTVGDAVHLACSDGSPALELLPGDEPGLHHLAFDLHRELDLDAAARALEKIGVTAQTWDGLSPEGAQAFKLIDPDGATIQVMSRPTIYPATAQPHQGIGVKPFKLGHVASRVDKLPDIIRFYQSGLGFRFSDMIGDDFVFMRCNSDHHSVNFLRAGTPRNIHHVAFELQDWNHVKLAADELWSHGVGLIWGPGRHGAGHNLYTYHHDPDGNIVELFAELDKMTDEGTGVYDWRPWHDGAQSPKRWDPHSPANNPWGILPPDKFLF